MDFAAFRRRLALLICPGLDRSREKQGYVLLEEADEFLRADREAKRRADIADQEAERLAYIQAATDDLDWHLAGFETDAYAWAHLIYLLKSRRLRSLILDGDDGAFLLKVRERVEAVPIPVLGAGDAQ